MNNILYTLHVGTWDEHHLAGIFSSIENAQKYIDFFNIKDNPVIAKINIDPNINIINSNIKPYLVYCTKLGKIKLNKHIKSLHEYFDIEHVHFSSKVMYYYTVAKNDEEALLKGEQMRTKQLIINPNFNDIQL